MLGLPDFRVKSIVMCFASDGQRISFKNDNLIITDKADQIILQATCYKLFSLWIIGHSTITSGILERSKKFGFSIYMLSHGFRPYGIWNSATEGNFVLRKRQYEYNDLDIARQLVNNKIENQCKLLKGIRSKSDELKESIHYLEGYKNQINEEVELKQLLGFEGMAAKLYFRHWFEGMPWKGRRPRAKTDVINTTLDIGYTKLFNFMEALLNLYGFDVYYGVYHRSFYQRKSLVCDLVEPFRCIIDKQVKKAYGLRQLQEVDFICSKGQFLLRLEQNKNYSKWLMQSILEEKEELFQFVQAYYRCFMRGKGIEAYPVFDIQT